MSAAAVFNSNDARKRRDRWRPCRSVVTTRPGRSDRARPRDPLGWRYLPAGAPPQFVREVQEHDDLVLLLGAWAEPSGITTATRLPSGARSQLVLQQDIHHRHGVFGRGVSIVPGRVAKKDIVRFHAVRRLTAWPSRPRRTTAETPGRSRGGWRCSRASSWLHGDQRRTRTSGSRRNTPRANH